MDEIYNEMYDRNTTWLLNNSIIPDPMLLTPELDNRKCVALVAHNEVELLDMQDIYNLCDPLCDYWMMPKVHSTFMVLRGWKEDVFVHEDWCELQNIIKDITYEIIFDRVIPVKTGLVLCGTPSININDIRDKIREMGYGTDSLYKCDIAHTTILRWTHDLPKELQQQWLNKIMSLSRKPYARIVVTGFNIILASWSMHPETTQIIT